MARTTGMHTLTQKIEKAQARVIKTKLMHEDAVAELQKLLDKRDALRGDEIMAAIARSDKSYEEILQLIQDDSDGVA